MNHQILGFPNQLQQPLPQPLPPILSEAFILFSPLRKAAPSAPLRRLELLSHGNETHSCGAPSSCCSQQPSGWANIESPSGDFFRWKSRLFMHFTIQEKWQIAISFHRKATIEGKIRNTSPSLLHQMPLWLVLIWRCSSSSHWIHNHRCSGCIPTHGDVVSWF